MTTLRKISEQIHRILEGGDVTSDSNHDRREINELVVQLINQQLKTEHISLNLPQREYVPPHVLIAKYSDIEVKGAATGGSLLRCTLLGPDLYEEWQTEGGDAWTTPGGDSWITGFDSSVNVAVTEVEGSGGYTYTISITGISFPAGTDIPTVQAAVDVELAKSSTYIKLLGLEAGFPNVFSVSGITSFTIGASSITISYSPSLTSLDAKVIADQTSSTHAILGAGTADYGTTVFDKMNSCSIATDAVAEKAYIELPAYPITLPRGMGVWRVYGADIDSPYIPMPSQVMGIAGAVTHNHLSTVLNNMVAYEWSDRDKIRFNKTIGEMPGTVNVELLIVDIATVAATDMLPITPEMEATVIRLALEVLGLKRNEDLVPDNNETIR